jgi:hypothetical protein
MGIRVCVECLNENGEESCFGLRQRQTELAYLQKLQTGSGAHLTTCLIGLGGCLSGGGGGVTQSRREAKHLFLFGDEFKNYKLICNHHQHSSLLHVMCELLGYMFRPFSCHLQAFKILKIKITLVTLCL